MMEVPLTYSILQLVINMISLSLIKDTVTVVSIIATLILGVLKYKDIKEISRLNNNITSTTKQWTDEKGRLVTQVTELRFTNDELERLAHRDSSTLNELEKQLWEAGQTIKDLKIKERNALSYNSVDISVSNDSLVSKAEYNDDKSLKALKPIKTDHLSIDFEIKGDTVLVNHSYKAKVSTVVDREVDKITNRGRKRFFIARWINPRWQYSAKSIVDDPNATIESAINIKFQRKKGKRHD